MSRARSEELRLVAEQATEWLQRPATTPKEREERLTWLMESPIHVREALAAMAWDEELGQLLDPDCRIDADALVAKALSNLITMEARRPTDVLASDAEGTLMNPKEQIEIVDLGDAFNKHR